MIERKYYDIRVEIEYVFLPTGVRGFYYSPKMSCLYSAKELLTKLCTKYNEYGYRIEFATLTCVNKEPYQDGE